MTDLQFVDALITVSYTVIMGIFLSRMHLWFWQTQDVRMTFGKRRRQFIMTEALFLALFSLPTIAGVVAYVVLSHVGHKL